MKGCGEEVVLLDQDREAVALGEDFDAGAGLYDARGADVDHFERAAGELGGCGFNGAVDLASVGVALDGGVEDAEAGLRRMQHFLCEEDAAGAGSEGGFGLHKLLKRGEKAIALEELEEGGGFAAGDDEAVDFG